MEKKTIQLGILVIVIGSITFGALAYSNDFIPFLNWVSTILDPTEKTRSDLITINDEPKLVDVSVTWTGDMVAGSLQDSVLITFYNLNDENSKVLEELKYELYLADPGDILTPVDPIAANINGVTISLPIDATHDIDWVDHYTCTGTPGEYALVCRIYDIVWVDA